MREKGLEILHVIIIEGIAVRIMEFKEFAETVCRGGRINILYEDSLRAQRKKDRKIEIIHLFTDAKTGKRYAVRDARSCR